MLKYVVNIEKSGVYANVAYWRLANNLCDTAADNNCPNSNWWLYRWYADMEGDLLDSKVIDVLHADFANVIKVELICDSCDSCDSCSINSYMRAGTKII